MVKSVRNVVPENRFFCQFNSRSNTSSEKLALIFPSALVITCAPPGIHLLQPPNLHNKPEIPDDVASLQVLNLHRYGAINGQYGCKGSQNLIRFQA